jgi:hypothetical protein
LLDFRIERIEIEKFRGLQSRLVVPMVDPAGNPVDQFIVAGVNGSGKTSLLEGVLLGLGAGASLVPYLPTVRRQDHWRASVPAEARIGLDVLLRNGELMEPWRRWRVECKQGVFVWGAMSEAGEVGTWGPMTENLAPRIEYFSSWRVPLLVGGVRPTVRDLNQGAWEANRLQLLKQRVINHRARSAFGEVGYENLWLNRINKAWQTFHGNDLTRIDALVVKPNADDPEFDLFVMEGNSRICSIDEVSSGELELVTIAGTLAMRDDLGLIVIDEPELHLHPDWQGRLIPAIRELAPRAQILAATHADEPWDRVRSWERVFLAHPGDPRTDRTAVQ